MEKVQKYSVVAAVLLVFVLMNVTFLFLSYVNSNEKMIEENEKIKQNYELKITALENQINCYEMTITDLQELDSNTAELFIGLLRNHE